MFGYIIPHHETLSSDSLARYRSLYCGLCHSLKRFSLAGRLTLTYDLTFLACVLSSLYEPKESKQTARCMVHPAKKQAFIQSEIIDYAAEMNLALCYHKLQDDWKDDKNLAACAGAKVLQRSYQLIAKKYPLQCANMEQNLARIAQAEATTPFAVDDAVNAFADLMGNLFLYKEDRWSDTLYALGASLGRFIYMMDAFDDCEKDAKKQLPNPFTAQPDAQQVRELLTILLGECAMALEALPLEQDLSILRNILYAGVWTRFEMKLQKQDKHSR